MSDNPRPNIHCSFTSGDIVYLQPETPEGYEELCPLRYTKETNEEQRKRHIKRARLIVVGFLIVSVCALITTLVFHHFVISRTTDAFQDAYSPLGPTTDEVPPDNWMHYYTAALLGISIGIGVAASMAHTFTNYVTNIIWPSRSLDAAVNNEAMANRRVCIYILTVMIIAFTWWIYRDWQGDVPTTWRIPELHPSINNGGRPVEQVA
jgi:ABC-type phosphate transport system permease subunit